MLPLLLTKGLPGWKNALLALLSAVLLILAFPDFDYWFLAWFALVPLMWAVEREKERGHSCPPESDGRSSGENPQSLFRALANVCGQECPRSFVLGWIFGTTFFFGTCWWLTYAPITYAAFPPILAYFLLFCVCLVAGLFPAMFAGILSILLRRFGSLAFLAAPFIWVFTEFLRYWITGNNWNTLGYSQAFAASSVASIPSLTAITFTGMASVGGVLFTSFVVIVLNLAVAILAIKFNVRTFIASGVTVLLLGVFTILFFIGSVPEESVRNYDEPTRRVIAIQPDVPMSGLDKAKWNGYRRRHVELAEATLAKIDRTKDYVNVPPLVIFPESPMNFMYETDPETRQFIDGFARKNNVSVLFNSAEPDPATGKFFNSAVMVGPQGGEVAQYDKIYLLPFGEAVPFPLEGLLPGFVGNFSYGREYDLLPLGDAKAGVMICFESHFGQLSREYVRNGADAIIEMTNDGYLGPTPVLRQHLANAVFRAVETNRPVLRVTNVGITAYINERGEVLDAAQPYTEDTRVWSVAKSDGSQTLYVRYGDWFAWLCSLVTIVILGLALKSRDAQARA